jgi:glycosyltransferase involved in cell wall biosynthesis
LLYVGTLEPRKNLVRLIRAFGRWKSRAGADAAEYKLVLAGGRGWFFQQIFDCVAELQLEDEVVFPGFIADEELPAWYRAAEAFVYPSLLEGFGLPVLEAMASGTPVLCSNIPSLIEIVGDCAVRVAPHDEDNLVAGLSLLMGQPAVRQALRECGIARAARFSWLRTARETVEIYARVAGNSKVR